MDFILDAQAKTNELGHNLADVIITFPLLFNICHIILTLHSIKSEWVLTNAVANPFASYLMGLCCCNAGGILTSILTNNKTILECILFGDANNEILLVYSIIWWLTFYCPFNAFSKILYDSKIKKGTIIMKIFIIGKELLRCKKIYSGVALGKQLYNDINYLPFSILLGTLSSNGTGFLVNCGKFITARPYSGLVLLSTSTLAKFSVLFAIFYTIYPESKYTIVLLQFIILSNYKLNLMPVEQSINKSFQTVGYFLTTPLGEDRLIEKKVEKSSSKRSSTSLNDKKKQ